MAGVRLILQMRLWSMIGVWLVIQMRLWCIANHGWYTTALVAAQAVGRAKLKQKGLAARNTASIADEFDIEEEVMKVSLTLWVWHWRILWDWHCEFVRLMWVWHWKRLWDWHCELALKKRWWRWAAQCLLVLCIDDEFGIEEEVMRGQLHSVLMCLGDLADKRLSARFRKEEDSHYALHSKLEKKKHCNDA